MDTQTTTNSQFIYGRQVCLFAYHGTQHDCGRNIFPANIHMEDYRNQEIIVFEDNDDL